VTPAAASPTKEAEEWETIRSLATAIIRLRQVSQSAAAVPRPVTVEGVCAGTGSQIRLLGCRTPQSSEGLSSCESGCSRLFLFLAWVIFGSVELRGGFLGAHGYRNSPHLAC
jgi:hypothetical protein